MHTHFFIFSTFFLFFYFLGPAHMGWVGSSQPGPVTGPSQASDPAGPKPTGGTRGVSPRVHAQRER